MAGILAPVMCCNQEAFHALAGGAEASSDQSLGLLRGEVSFIVLLRAVQTSGGMCGWMPHETLQRRCSVLDSTGSRNLQAAVMFNHSPVVVVYEGGTPWGPHFCAYSACFLKISS